MPRLRHRIAAGELLAETRRVLRGHDLLLIAAALTFYAALGLIPLLVVALRLATALLGGGTVRTVGAELGRYLPSALHVARGVQGLAGAGSRAPWPALIACLVPASFYSEGIVRAFDRLGPAPGTRSRSLRGRVATGVLVAVTAGAVVALIAAAHPLADRSLGSGLGARVLGIYLTFLVGWAVAGTLLVLIYRAFPPQRPGWPAALWAGAAAGSWVSGQTLGFVLVLRIAGGVGTAYGGSALAGVAATLLFFLYLTHLVVIAGYALARSLDSRGGSPLRSVSDAPATPVPAGRTPVRRSTRP